MNIATWALSAAILLTALFWKDAAGATSPAYDKCMEKAGIVTANMRDCAGDEEVRQERVLNALYKQALGRRDAAGRDKLRDQERAWLKRRHREVDKIFNEEGSESLLVSDDHYLQLTDRRIAELRALATGKPLFFHRSPSRYLENLGQRDAWERKEFSKELEAEKR